MDTLTHGFEGAESFLEEALINRGVTLAQHTTKMENLSKLAREGFRVVKAVHHDKYEVRGREGFYNPYTDESYL
jgi:hypothetical protein